MDSEILGLIVKELNKNGVNLIKHDFSNIDTFSPENVDYFRPGELPQIFDFSEHDKVFEDKIAKLENEVASYKRAFEDKCKDYDFTSELLNKFGEENELLEKRITELENENKKLNIRIFQKEAYGDEKSKINLNDRIKVKLTPLGVKIYYHQYDELNKKIKENGGTQLEPRMPEIDKDGFTEFTLWHFMELYGEHIGMCKPNVINPLDIIIVE